MAFQIKSTKQSMTLFWIKLFMLISICLGLPCGKATAAERISKYQLPYLGIQVGGARTEKDGFHDSGSYGLFAGLYLFGNTSLELGGLAFNRFDHKDLADTRVEARTAILGLAHRFDLSRWLALRPGIGALAWDAQSYYLGNATGEDNGMNLTADLAILFTIKRRVFITIDNRWLNNISGTDIYNASLGVGVNF